MDSRGMFTRRRGGTEGEPEEMGLEEIARRYLLRPVGGFLPEDREGWGQEKVSINVNKYHGPRR